MSLLENGHSNWAVDAEDRIIAVEKEMAEAGIGVVKAGDVFPG